MTITPDIESRILRYYYAEKWRVGTIAKQFGVHRDVIKRVLSKSGLPKAQFMPKPSKIEPYMPFVLNTLKQYPTLTAARLYDMVCERGYQGSPSHFRSIVAMHRPQKPAEAFLRLKTLPGEQAQVDWAACGSLTIGQAIHPLVAFVMVLSYSRKIFLQFYLRQRLENFLRGHVAAFNAWGGVPRVVLYDNLKSCVLERQGEAIRFHPTMLELSAHYRYEPRPVAIARGNEKGRVERSIRYIRDNFLAGRQWKDLDNLNAQALDWCNHQASNRPCPEDKTKTVQVMFEEEQPRLLPLPNVPYFTDEKETIRSRKTPYVRFDKNDYSIPHTHVRRTLTILASLETVRILHAGQIIATHSRCFDKGQQIEQPEHVQALVDEKKQARQHRGQNYLVNALPSANDFLVKAAEKNYSLRYTAHQLLMFIDDYGAALVDRALKEALELNSPHPNTVRAVIERYRANQTPQVHLPLPNDKRVRECVIPVHSLDGYDQLKLTEKEDNSNDD